MVLAGNHRAAACPAPHGRPGPVQAAAVRAPAGGRPAVPPRPARPRPRARSGSAAPARGCAWSVSA
jgi:hypothetical protein